MNANGCKLRMILMTTMVAMTAAASAQVSPPPVFEAQNCDPCVPASVRQKALAAAPLPAQTLPEAVTQRLKARFDAADVNRSGTLTRAQAEAGGFGFIALNFEAMDRRKAGAVTFEDLTLFLSSRGAKLN
ncbi:MAG: hypothetical protein SF172_00165 [Burkholderiales bacterium]|nr:hypothetical protein [Burkholderiales bacterium]